MKKHMLFCGDVGVGKSTLIQKIIKESNKPLYGFMTKRLESDPTGFHPIYIHPASEALEDRKYENENCIGNCNGKNHNIQLDVFNSEGVRLIKESRPGGLLVMDELGFMEAEADAFVQAVFDALDGDIPIIAAIKSRKDIPFLEKVKNHPKAEAFMVTKENRDVLFIDNRLRWKAALQ